MSESEIYKEKSNKRMIPICILHILLTKTSYKKRMTVKEISEILSSEEYDVKANRDTVNQNLTDILSMSDKLCEMGFPEILYDEKERKRAVDIKSAELTDPEDIRENETQILRTKFYMDDPGTVKFDRTEIATLLNFLNPSLEVKDEFAIGLAKKLEELSEDKLSYKTSAFKSHAPRRTMTDMRMLSSAKAIIQKAIADGVAIEFTPFRYNTSLKPVPQDKVVFDPCCIMGDKVVGYKDGTGELTSYRIDKLLSLENPHYVLTKRRYDELNKNKTDKKVSTDIIREETYRELQRTERYVSVLPLSRKRKRIASATELEKYLSNNSDIGSDNIRVVMNLKVDAIDDFADFFGVDFKEGEGIITDIDEAELPCGYCRAVVCTSPDYAMRWAMFNSDKCEITEPQILRDRIGAVASGLSERTYLKDAKDYYRVALGDAKKRGHLALNMPGFENRTEHYALADTVSLNVSSNKLRDISFIENYAKLRHAMILAHYVSDYSPIGRLPSIQALYVSSDTVDNLDFLNETKTLRCLHLITGEIKDISALYKPMPLEILTLDIRERERLDIAKIREVNPFLHIKFQKSGISNGITLDEIKWKASVDRRFTDVPYPLNTVYSTHSIYEPKYNTYPVFDVSPKLFNEAEFGAAFTEVMKSSEPIVRRAVSLVFENGLTMREAARELFGEELVNEKYSAVFGKYAYIDSFMEAVKKGNGVIAPTDFVIRAIRKFSIDLEKSELFKRVEKANREVKSTDEVKEQLLKNYLESLRHRSR